MIAKFKAQKFLYNFVLIFTLVLFVALTLFVGVHHEHNIDEAQAWLLARDTSFWELFKYIHYEITPPLWHIILKVLIFFKLPYDYFYVMPVIFSSLGIGLFLFKSKFPLWVKVLFPFTYYIFYQYTIVARNYCLILPLLSGLAIVYNKKLQKPFLFGALLILFSDVSIHCLLAAGMIFLLYLFEFYNNLKKQTLSRGLIKKNWITIVIIFLSFMLTIILIAPARDYAFIKGIQGQAEIGMINLILVGNILGNLLVNNKDNFIQNIFGISFLIIFIFSFYRKSYKIIEFLFIFVPVVLFLIFAHFAYWHLGILFLLMFFCFWVHFDESKYEFKNNKVFYILILIIFAVQIKWSINSVLYDLNNNYSAATQAAEYIKKQTGKNKVIWGLGYSVIAIQPYFKENIFKNQNTTFYIWNKKPVTVLELDGLDLLFQHNMDIVVIPNPIGNVDINKYKVQYFKGSNFAKNSTVDNENILIVEKRRN